MKQLTKSFEDYLEAIYILEQKGTPIKSVRISEMLEVSRPAVNKAMNELKERGFVSMDYYSSIELTDEGRFEAKRIYDKHLVIKNFLLKIGVSTETAEIDCCKIEHIISDETLNCFKKFL